MKTFDANIVTELDAEQLRFYWLLELVLTSTWRFTDCDIPIYVSGNKYSAGRPWRVTGSTIGASMAADRVGLEISDLSQSLASDILAADPRGKQVKISFCCLDTDHQLIAAEDWINGFIDDYGLSEKTFTAAVVNELALWNKRTLRKDQVDCPWDFKGTECGYSGAATSCDRTYERCLALSNTDNFGGERWLADIEEKKILWGYTLEKLSGGNPYKAV